MTAVIQFRQTCESGFDEGRKMGGSDEFCDARNLQGLLDISAKVIGGMEVDHAVLFGWSDARCSLVLPLLPVAAEVQEAMHLAVEAGAHPATTARRPSCEVGAMDRLCESGSEDSCKVLIDAFRAAGLKHVHEVPLLDVDGASYTLELGWVDGRIDGAKLRELRTIGQVILSKLPWIVRGPLVGGQAVADSYVVL